LAKTIIKIQNQSYQANYRVQSYFIHLFA